MPHRQHNRSCVSLNAANVYHNVAEALIELYTKQCLHLQECSGSNTTRFLSLHTQHPLNANLSWAQEAPYMADYLPCASPYPVVHYGHPSLLGQARPWSWSTCAFMQGMSAHAG